MTCVKDFQKVMQDFIKFQPQLVLLDVNLPFYDSFYWCRQIREVSHVSILFISSRSDDKDKIMGMSQGADDIVNHQTTSTLICHDRSLDQTRSEKKIMSVLVDHRPKIVSREELMMALWQTDEFISDSTLTVLVSQLFFFRLNNLRKPAPSVP